MTILDSCVWIAFFNESDSQHAKARKIFEVLSSRILLPEHVVLEVATVLSLRASKGIADIFIERVIDNSDIEIRVFQHDEFFEVCRDYRRSASARLSFVDIALLGLSAAHTVVTFDRHLKKAIDAPRRRKS
ncbi:MAG: type II toxin-antitoxin system VapC family toxin [Patescibacteria group bacterium]